MTQSGLMASGNPQANPLPRAQIAQFYRLLISLNRRNEGLSVTRAVWSRFSKKATMYIWIDALCIPLEDSLRKQAIALMYSVYQNATKVLLLDEPLLNVSFERPEEELCFRITASPWMRRAWTLQDGGLARSLFIQFANGPVRVETMIQRLVARTTGSESYNVILMQSCMILQYVQKCGEESDALLVLVHRILEDRSTSKPVDKKICLATMLRCDMPRVMEAKGQSRAQRVYEQFKLIPSSFFWHRGPCLDVPGVPMGAQRHFQYTCKRIKCC